MARTVRNINGTSDTTCKCGSWLKHWGVDDWIARNRARYDDNGFGLWAVEWSKDGSFVGDCGLVMQSLEETGVVEVGYHVLPAWQRRGIATEAALACRDYARDVLQVGKLYAFVRPENEGFPSSGGRAGAARREKPRQGRRGFLT